MKSLALIIVSIIFIGGCIGGNVETSDLSAPKLDAQNDETLFRISESSETRFIIDEILRGEPKTVIGKTNQIAGDIIVSTDSGLVEIGIIQINARAFETDSTKRDGATRRFILQSDQDVYEFIEFAPLEFQEIPERIILGEEFSFKVIGDLKIRDITSQVTFMATATVMEDSIVGSATSTISRSTYDLNIPDVPFVASVGDEVILEIDISASVVE